MGMSLDTMSKMFSEEEAKKLMNGDYYIQCGLDLIEKEKIDNELNKIYNFMKDIIDDKEEVFKERVRLNIDNLFDYGTQEYWSNQETQEFLNTLEYIDEDKLSYLTFDEWSNYKDYDFDYPLQRFDYQQEINGQNIYCLIESRYW